MSFVNANPKVLSPAKQHGSRGGAFRWPLEPRLGLMKFRPNGTPHSLTGLETTRSLIFR